MKLGVVWLVLVLVLVLAHMWFSRGSSWVKPNMHECCMLWHVWCHVLWHVCMVVYRMVWHVWFHMLWHGCRWFNFGSALGHLAVAKGDWSRFVSVVVQLCVV